MTEFEMPLDELLELSTLLEKKQLEVLRDQTARAQRTKQRLEKYTSRIWLFPFGVFPDTSGEYPVQVFRNGIALWMGKEAKLVKIEGTKPLVVVVLRYPARDDDLILAEYLAIPMET